MNITLQNQGLLACRPVVDETRDELATLARDPRWLERAEP